MSGALATNGAKAVEAVPAPVRAGAGGDRVLVVDDEANVRWALGRVLERQGYACVLAADAAEAHALLDAEQFDLAVCDLKLPGESGLDLVRHMLSEHASVAALVVTGRNDPRLAQDLVELGADGYLIKPFNPSQLVIDVSSALSRRRRRGADGLEPVGLTPATAARADHLQSHVVDMARVAGEQHAVLEEAIACLAHAVELHCGSGEAHSVRVATRCAELGRTLGLAPDHCERLRLACQLHDLGKLAVPEHILRKEGPLTSTEQAEIEEHPLVGYRILAASQSPVLQLAATIALTHHERYDGLGYPSGLAGKAIPIEGRITAVVDTFDALTSDRPYRAALTVEEALPILVAQRGRAFDPCVLDAFVESLNGAAQTGAQAAE
jgi:putative two-component system response regulator